jgi:hypothetical protein
MRPALAQGHALGVLQVTGFGIAGKSHVSIGTRGVLTPEITIGLFSMRPSYIPETYLTGASYSQGFFVLPAYIGVRYTLGEGVAGETTWSLFVRGGGGPAVGLLSPLGTGFFDSFARTSVHWGVGAFAATGVDFTFSNWATVFLQGGVDYAGFIKRVGDRNEFLGPSFSVGVGKLLP